MDKPVKEESKVDAVPLPIRIVGGPVLIFLVLFSMWHFLGGLWDWPAFTVAVVAAAVLAWVRVLWPAGFRRGG